MSKSIERIALPEMSPGTSRSLLLHRYGNATGQGKAFIQASLHADETPAMLVAHHLLRLLDEAEQRGDICGEILVVPACNPVGLAQVVNGKHLGRHDLRGGGNFNRAWPDLYEGLVDSLRDRLGNSAAENVNTVRAAIRERLDSLTAQNEIDSLKLALAKLAFDADIVLDMHCADESLLYVYMTPAHWPAYRDLAAHLGAAAVLLCPDSGGASFDESLSTPWLRLAAAVGDEYPVPPACFSATLEFRGQADVSDELAAADAAALFRFLQGRGFIAGQAHAPPELACQATNLDAAEYVVAPCAGIVSYRATPGDQVRKGEQIADIINPLAESVDAAATPVCAGTDGLLLSRSLHKLVAPGDSVGMVVGTETLEHRKGTLLFD